MKTIRSKSDARRLRKQWQTEFGNDRDICFLLQDWDDGYNVGGLFRVADGLGATELIMTGKTPVPPHPMIGVTSLGHHRRIAFRYFEKHGEAAETLAEEGWTLVAIEIADDAVPIMDFEWPDRICFVLGNEGAGVYDSVMKHVSASVFIPMFGKGKSLNVHVAGAIAGFAARLAPNLAAAPEPK